MRHRARNPDEETEIDADLKWLRGEEGAAPSAVPSAGNLAPAAGRVSLITASKRSSSVGGLRKLLQSDHSITICGARRSKSGESTQQYHAQHNPLFQQQRPTTHTDYNSLPGSLPSGSLPSRYSSSPSRHACIAGTACLSDPSSLQGLRTHSESISQQLNTSKNVVAELFSGNGMLQQRLSQRNADTQRAVAALLQHNGQLQHQLHQVLLPVQQQPAETKAHEPAYIAETPVTSRGGSSTTTLTFSERKLLKFVKRLQKDKDRLNEQVQQLLQNQTRLLQQVHENASKAAASQTSPQQKQQQQAVSPARVEQQQQHLQKQQRCSIDPGTGLLSTWVTSSSALDDDSQLQMQLQQLQQQLDSLGSEQPGAVSVGMYDTTGMSREWLAPRQSDACLQQQQQQQHRVGSQQMCCQTQQVIEDQAATIVELKKVIAELQQQTTMLRSQNSKQCGSAEALADSQAALAAKHAQLRDLQQQHKEVQELSQAAIRDAVRAAQAAEVERDKLQVQLGDEGRKRDEAQAGKEALAAEVERLRRERQQLLLRLVEANEQITDLHDELGPALVRGSPTRRGSSIARASRAWQLAEAGWSSSGSPNEHSGVGQQLSAAVTELSDRTQAMVAAREAAAKEVKDVQAAYSQLQQQHGELQARHQLLKEEHAQLLSRQLGVATDRGSLRRQYLATEEQYLAAKQQILELQSEIASLKAPGQTTSTTQPASAPADTTGSSDQAVQKHLMLSLAAENARLAVALAELMQEQDSLREQLQQQQPGGYMASAAAAGSDVQEQQRQQRLQLLVSQLVMVRDQAAAAASVSQQQQERLQNHQQQLVQLTAELALLQQQHAKLQCEQLQQAQVAVLAALEAEAEPAGSLAAVAQATAENFKLRLELVNQGERLRQLAAEKEALQAAAVDQAVLRQLEAKNKALLQEVTWLLSEVSDVRQQLWEAQGGAATGHLPGAASPQIQQQQQQQQAVVSPQSNATASPVSSRHTSTQPSLSQLFSETPGVTRSPTLSQAASFRGRLANDTAELAGVTSTVAISPFSTMAASAARSPCGSGSTTPSALRSRSFNEGHRLQVSWSEQLKLENDTAAAAAGSPRRSPLGAPKRMSVHKLEQPGGDTGAALNSMLLGGPSASASAAAAAAAAADDVGNHVASHVSRVQDDGGMNSRVWTGLQPTPRSSTPSQAAVTVTADQVDLADAESAAPLSFSSNSAALAASALERQRSKSSPAGAGEGSNAEQQQQQQQRFKLNPVSSGVRSSSSFAAANSQCVSAAGSADGSAAAAGQDRAALIAAVLQRQKAKQAGESPNSSFAFAASAGTGANGASAGCNRGDSVAGALSAQASAGALQLPPPTGSAVGKDRASIVAAVLAQRQQKQQQQQQGDSIQAAQASSAGSSLHGAGSGRMSAVSPTDRAALVAAVLAKHNLGK